MPSLTVEQLIAALKKRPPGDKVYIWLPGTKIALSNVFPHILAGVTMIEGNVEEGELR